MGRVHGGSIWRYISVAASLGGRGRRRSSIKGDEAGSGVRSSCLLATDETIVNQADWRRLDRRQPGEKIVDQILWRLQSD